MTNGGHRFLKQLAHEQAGELLGEDTNRQRRIRSAEGVRYAFRDYAPIFSESVQVKELPQDTIPNTISASDS